MSYPRRMPSRCRGTSCPGPTRPANKEGTVEFILWLIAVVLVVSGIVSLVRGQILWGVALIIIGLLVGPGGVSIFT